MRCAARLACPLGLLLAACATGNETPPPDLAAPPDRRAVDHRPEQRTPEGGLCGNGQLDPGEKCDRAIAAGQPGACPKSAADCDDSNRCTADRFEGDPALCTASCAHQPVDQCCGNGKLEAPEECDDGNLIDTDECTNTCTLPGGHLLISEVAVAPSEAELVEIFNPAAQPVALDKVYLADRVDYYQITKGSLSSVSTDFVARFPAGSSIPGGGRVTVAIQGALDFKATFGKAPDFELRDTDTGVPDMLPAVTGSIGSQAGLTDAGEVLVLFTWDGSADLVSDLDYVVWRSTSGTSMCKTGVCVDGPDADTTTSCYTDDTATSGQSFLTPPQQGGSLHRCSFVEGTEKKSGGNGVGGHDETSEPFDGAGATWKRNASTPKLRTPGEPPPAGFCTGS